MPDEPLSTADGGGPARVPAEDLFNLRSGREFEQRLSNEAHQLWRDLGHEFSSRTIAERLLTSYGTLPPTRITSEESDVDIRVQGSLSQRTGRLDAASDLGTVSLEVRGQRDPCRLSHVPGLSGWSYDLNAQSANQQTQLRVWSEQANRMPNINFGTQVGDVLTVNYQRDEQREVAGLTAALRQTDVTAAHDFRRHQFNLSAVRRLEDNVHFGLNFNHGPNGRYDVGAQIRLGPAILPPVMPYYQSRPADARYP